MLNDDIPVISDRSELIKRARESCSRSLVDSNTYPTKSGYNRRISEGEDSKIGDGVLSIKFFVIRVVVALILLIGVITIDKTKLTYQGMSSTQISELIHSNHLYEQAKEYVSFIFKEDSKEVMNNEADSKEVLNSEVDSKEVLDSERDSKEVLDNKEE